MNFVHLLVECSGGVARARCGQTLKFHGRLPNTFSGWASDVTCTSCIPAAQMEAAAALRVLRGQPLLDLAKHVFACD